jgi:hypothetical protein
MSTKPAPKPSTHGAAPLLKNAAAAPFIYFDNVPVFGACAGNLEIELAARGFSEFSRPPKKLRPAFGGRLAAREPVWDGEGWGCDRIAGS